MKQADWNNWKCNLKILAPLSTKINKLIQWTCDGSVAKMEIYGISDKIIKTFLSQSPRSPFSFHICQKQKSFADPDDHKLIKNRNKRERNWKLDGEIPAAKLVRWKFVKTWNHLRLNAPRSFKWFTIFVYTCSQMQLIYVLKISLERVEVVCV